MSRRRPKNPFKIDGPALVSFSGGRTSGLMLRRILDAGIDDDVHVCFANTGKEREETLDFVREVSVRWGVGITWLERDDGSTYEHHDAGDEATRPRYRVVRHETASRAGEPFRRLILDRNYMPNPVTRFCTTELKIRVMKNWMIDQGYEHWSNIVGLRADEPGRVANMREQDGKNRWTVSMPLAEAGVRLADVETFWRGQPFQLALRPWEGNCDVCYLKGHKKRERIIRDRPDLAPWWVESETLIRDLQGKLVAFRSSGPSYADLLNLARRPMLFTDEEMDGEDLDDLGDCVCTGAT